MKKELLRRNAELPYRIDFLARGKLSLLDPAKWDDRNDSYFLEHYTKQMKLKTIRALCLTESSETYHHWRVFGNGGSSVCFDFIGPESIQAIQQVKGIRAEHVTYRTIDEIREVTPGIEELPFLKRYVFSAEEEFRLFVSKKANVSGPIAISVPTTSINRIILSPWLPAEVGRHVRNTIFVIDGRKDLLVVRSTLIENEEWKKLDAV